MPGQEERPPHEVVAALVASLRTCQATEPNECLAGHGRIAGSDPLPEHHPGAF